MIKEDKIRRWEDICRRGLHPPTIERWTDDDENALQQASRLDLEVGDTALGPKKEIIQADSKEVDRGGMGRDPSG